MKLYFKKNGEGFPLLILHGLFGLGDNWATLSKAYAEQGFAVYIIDSRNHGRSEHSHDFSYDAMADDLAELMADEKLSECSIIGHSMGGKTAMFFAMKYPQLLHKLIVADIAPRKYAPHHQSIFAALHSVDVENITSRKEAEEKLRAALKDEGTIQFLLKNLYWKTETQLDWRFGLAEIEKNIGEIGKALPGNDLINTPTLFLKGSRSGYINESDDAEIRARFSNVSIDTISNAGHWLHAENPKEFFEKTILFLK